MQERTKRPGVDFSEGEHSRCPCFFHCGTPIASPRCQHHPFCPSLHCSSSPSPYLTGALHTLEATFWTPKTSSYLLPHFFASNDTESQGPSILHLLLLFLFSTRPDCLSHLLRKERLIKSGAVHGHMGPSRQKLSEMRNRQSKPNACLGRKENFLLLSVVLGSLG